VRDALRRPRTPLNEGYLFAGAEVAVGVVDAHSVHSCPFECGIVGDGGFVGSVAYSDGLICDIGFCEPRRSVDRDVGRVRIGNIANCVGRIILSGQALVNGKTVKVVRKNWSTSRSAR